MTLVANSKMGEMTLFILTAEGHRNWVDTCAEIAAAVGDGVTEGWSEFATSVNT